MVLYNYAKYNVNSSTTYSEGTWGAKKETAVSQLKVGASAFTYRDGYSWNGTTYVGTGASYSGPTANKYYVSSDGRSVDQALTPIFTSYTGDYYSSKTITRKANTTYSRGAFIETVVAEDGAYPNNERHTDGFWYSRLGLANATPTVTLDTPTQNQTLYENDVLSIAGSAAETDIGNSVTIRYQINAETARAIKAFVSTGSAESFSKQLTFKGGSLYDGDTLIASNLTDGIAHTLKVYATDDQGGQSSITEMTFYVVPNRAPSLTINSPVTAGSIDSDEIEITGSYDDLDKNTSVVSYRINGGNSVQVASGTNGNFDFKIQLGQLKVGLNNIVVEVIDSHGAKTSRTVKLQKNEIKTEQLKSTVRYKILPPLGAATGIVVWVRRDENLILSASISMTQTGEAESFVPMERKVTGAPIVNTPGIVEDQFQYENAVSVDNIIWQLELERSSLMANEKVHVLVGVID